MKESPYQNRPVSQWKKITEDLLETHPLHSEQIVSIVLNAWKSIMKTKIGGELQIGKQIFPKPQIMGFFLHELIPLQLTKIAPDQWKRDEKTEEKDVVFIPNPFFSIEIKTSSDKNQIFGNRSFAQENTKGKKSKSGYYLCVNFEPFVKKGVVNANPQINLIRFGWLDASDWIGQKASTGQQARLSKEVYEGKFITLYQKLKK